MLWKFSETWDNLDLKNGLEIVFDFLGGGQGSIHEVDAFYSSFV